MPMTTPSSYTTGQQAAGSHFIQGLSQVRISFLQWNFFYNNTYAYILIFFIAAIIAMDPIWLWNRPEFVQFYRIATINKPHQ